ncbi:hypothetical protein MKK63_18430 [Methylobacterium sp. J-088]|uniref:hypothetical protein n=1 Tax=unclassified Methylobacterium TaxID=2615210 RepID=UPI001FBBE08C|nr:MULTISPECIES: hypothetical protein [unclassified Methylobacterium]MCJ2064675.1 hypothetical protein [Methylobacterium sp. J-088]
MARDQSSGAGDPARERAAAERAGRKRLGENGRPQPAPTPVEQDAAHRRAVTGPQDPNAQAVSTAVDGV